MRVCVRRNEREKRNDFEAIDEKEEEEDEKKLGLVRSQLENKNCFFFSLALLARAFFLSSSNLPQCEEKQKKKE